MKFDTIIPTGGIYTTNSGIEFKGNEKFPLLQDRDTFQYEDYSYIYYEDLNGWQIDINDDDKKTYGEIPESISQKPIVSMELTFINCSNLIEAPKIPNSVTNLAGTFYNCSSLTKVPPIPQKVTDLSDTFKGCASLKSVKFKNPYINIEDAFNIYTDISLIGISKEHEEKIKKIYPDATIKYPSKLSLFLNHQEEKTI